MRTVAGGRSLPALAVDPYSTPYFPKTSVLKPRLRKRGPPIFLLITNLCGWAHSGYCKLMVYSTVSDSYYAPKREPWISVRGFRGEPRGLGSPEWRLRRVVRPGCTTTSPSQSKSRLGGGGGQQPTVVISERWFHRHVFVFSKRSQWCILFILFFHFFFLSEKRNEVSLFPWTCCDSLNAVSLKSSGEEISTRY